MLNNLSLRNFENRISILRQNCRHEGSGFASKASIYKREISTFADTLFHLLTYILHRYASCVEKSLLFAS